MLIGQQRIKYCEIKNPAEKAGEKNLCFAVIASQLYLLRKLYFDFIKVIFRLSPKLYFG